MTALRTNLVNGFATTLASPMGATATSLVLTTASGLPAVPFYLVIDPENLLGHREVILVDTSVVSTTLTLSTTAKRYLAGSAAGSGLAHSAGEVVRMAVVEQLFEDLHDRVDEAYGPGLDDVLVTDGGTGASTFSGAQANLHLLVGTDIPSLTAFITEISDRAAADVAVAGLVTTEASTRAAADTTLGGRVTTLEAGSVASVAWVPTLSGWTLGNGILDCWKHIDGKWCDFDFKLTVGSTTSFGSKLLVPPPATVKRTNRSAVATGAAIRAADGFNALLVVDLVSGNFQPNVTAYPGSFVQINPTGGGMTATGAPFTWAAPDVVAFSGRVELA